VFQEQSPYLKSRTRAIQKALLAYGGDIRQLTDLCRMRIHFADVGSLTKCLSEITRDADVKIVRIKNRLNPDYSAHETLGYRDVNLNLRFVHSDAQRLGVQRFICELQLTIEDFAAKLDSDNHKRFQDFRDVRAIQPSRMGSLDKLEHLQQS